MTRKLTALVIGVAEYTYINPLKNSANDASDISSALEELGFSTIKKLNITNEEFDRSIDQFCENLNINDVGLFYFAGHGVQIAGENYLVAKDTPNDELFIKHKTYSLNLLIEKMHGRSNRTNIIILDACRDNPCKLTRSSGSALSGLATINAPLGTLIAFSTSPGQTAADGTERNSPYTKALLTHIKTPDITIEDFFKLARNTLSSDTNKRQISWEHTSLTGDFRFNISANSPINIYGENALADGNFSITSSDTISNAITKLRSHNWYEQNDGIGELELSEINDDVAYSDLLFVLGRNIYQAACGNSRSAEKFMEKFHELFTTHLQKDITTPQKYKAILDGMLFEVFFGREGEIRENFKTSKSKELLQLREIPEFEESFKFISDALVPHKTKIASDQHLQKFLIRQKK